MVTRFEHVCDFCDDPSPAWEYPCDPFIDPLIEPKDRLLACNYCHRLIMENAWDLLVERSLANHIVSCSSLYPIDDPEELSFHEARIRLDLRALFAKFQEFRRGPAKPFNSPIN